MNEFKFISYEATPQDQYILGIATVLAYGKIVLRYKHSKTKDGTTDFFAAASYGITDETGQKRYIDSFMFDSAMEKETVMAIVRKGVFAIKNAKPKQEMLYPPHGMVPPMPMPESQMTFMDANQNQNTPF